MPPSILEIQIEAFAAGFMAAAIIDSVIQLVRSFRERRKQLAAHTAEVATGWPPEPSKLVHEQSDPVAQFIHDHPQR